MRTSVLTASGPIEAVNRDPDASISKFAHHGLMGGLDEDVIYLTKQIQQRRSQGKLTGTK